MRAALLLIIAQSARGLRLASRRAAIQKSALAPLLAPLVVSAAEPETVTTASGLSYQDFTVGTGPPPVAGARVTVDYVMQTSGARYGSEIYSTREFEAPFSWQLGDPGVIAGLNDSLNEAVGSMRGGGVRRVYVPAALGYTTCAKEAQQPIPPPKDSFAEYQRWKNIYANPNRPYQPDLVLAVKLFGGRRGAADAS